MRPFPGLGELDDGLGEPGAGRGRTLARRALKAAAAVALLAALGLGVKWLVGRSAGNDAAADVLTATAVRGDLVITVTDRGELESAQSVDVSCDIEGGGKLVSILDQGVRVVKDQEVARFDTDALEKAINEQTVKWEQAEGKVKAAQSELDVQKNKADSEIAKADLALTLARIDFESYEEGEFKVETDKRLGALELAKKELKEAEDNLAFTENLIKKGLAQLEQRRVMELNLLGKRYVVSQQETDLRVLKEFQYKRKTTELKAKAEEAERELERTKKTQAAATEKAENELAAAQKLAELEKQQLDRLCKQREKCVVTAPQDGIVIYSKFRYWDPSSQIRPGATLHFQQPIFSLPDLDNMRVKMKVHESMVKKVQVGQPATMQIDALGGKILRGKVLSVATVAQGDEWRGGGVKEYETVVSIDNLPKDAGLRPGMTAEVKILVNTVRQAVSVPVQAVTELEGKHVCYVVSQGKLEPQFVEVGEMNEQRIQITKGLEEGQQVALDARLRAAAELKKRAGEDPASPEKKPAPESQPAGDQPAAAVTAL